MTAPVSGETIIPFRGVRRMIAETMHRSLAEAAQLTHHAECDVSNLLAVKEALAKRGADVSVEDLVIFCTIRTLARHPMMNGLVEQNQIRLLRSVHLGIAIALSDDTLVAPAIFDADRKTLEDLANARKALIARARAGKLTVAEMTGGTFTVSNLGSSRVRFFTPILNPPQIAILGVGGIERRPWVSPEGTIEPRPILGLSLTFDHRAVDGFPAARFLTDLCRSIDACGTEVH